MSPFWESATYSISAIIFELSNENINLKMMDHGTRKRSEKKPKRTRKTQKSAKEKPYVEQINEDRKSVV